MTVLAVLLLFLGGALIVLMPVWALLTWSTRRERGRVARLSVSRCADVTSSGRRLCAVEGRSLPAAAAPLIAPLSGEPCAWYFTEVEERSSLDGGSTSLVWQAGGVMPFEVRDETGSVLVDGRLVHPRHGSSRANHSPPVRRVVDEDVTSAQQSTSLQGLIARGVLSEKSFERRWWSSTLGWTVQEYVLPVGRQLHVQGRVGFRDGRPVLGGRRGYLVRGGTYAELTGKLEEDLRTDWGCLVIGTLAGLLLFAAGYLLARWIGG
jgi:E3 Ubiquitin ligase